MTNNYDIFISYKRKSLPTANNLYYRLTTRGYSTFFDLEEMGRDNFNVQLLNYIENAKDVFVILEEGSLDACKREDWEKDWFCHEIAFALEKKKNIIPILIGGYQMPSEDFFPDKLKELSLKNAPEFNFSFFEAYLNKLVEKNYLLSKPNLQDKETSIFKFYSNENCQVFKDGKLVCSLEGMSDEPYYLPVPRKGDYRFRSVNAITGAVKVIKEHIDIEEEKEIEIEWDERNPFKSDQEWPGDTLISGDNYTVDLGMLKFNMRRVEGGRMTIGATIEQGDEAESNEYPAHEISMSTYYISQYPITQNVWEVVMGYNKSQFKDKEITLATSEHSNEKPELIPYEIPDFSKWKDSHPWLFTPFSDSKIMSGMTINRKKRSKLADDPFDSMVDDEWSTKYDDAYCHYPVESVSHDEALEFVRRLTKMTNIQFALPTEDEWEYAARGGQKSYGFKYSGSNNIGDVAWYRGNSDGTTHPVGEKQPNELGLYDMSGNVWEWTETPAHSYASEVIPSGTLFIRRGGSWWHKDKNCRVSRRYASDHLKKTSGLGLRVVIRNVMYNREYTYERISELKENEIFVFGSNLAGTHGGGAALLAYRKFGAIWGQGVGLQGQSYGIPTMQGGVETIKPYVDEFIEFARHHCELKFLVTKIGCGIAGFRDEEIAPLFKDALNQENVILPKEFVNIIQE